MNDKIEILKSVYEYITNVDNRIMDIANEIREGKNYKEIPNLVEGVTYIMRALPATKEIHNIDIDVENIKDIISDMLDGFENGDNGLIADIMEYEFKPMFEQWKKTLKGYYNV